MSRRRKPGPKKRISFCCGSVPTSNRDSRKSQPPCHPATPRCATAVSADSPTTQRTAGARTKTPASAHSWIPMAKPGETSSPPSQVPLSRSRPQLQAAEGPLRELPASRPAEGRLDGLGRPAVDKVDKSTRQELEDNRGQNARPQQEPTQESVLRPHQTPQQ